GRARASAGARDGGAVDAARRRRRQRRDGALVRPGTCLDRRIDRHLWSARLADGAGVVAPRLALARLGRGGGERRAAWDAGLEPRIGRGGTPLRLAGGAGAGATHLPPAAGALATLAVRERRSCRGSR